MAPGELCRKHGICQGTLYRWKAKFGGMDVSEARRLRQLEDENRRLKHLVADLSLDKEALKGLIAKNGWSLVARRREVSWMQEKYAVSERSACRLVGMDRKNCWD